jgi:hypothetical protein
MIPGANQPPRSLSVIGRLVSGSRRGFLIRGSRWPRFEWGSLIGFSFECVGQRFPAPGVPQQAAEKVAQGAAAPVSGEDIAGQVRAGALKQLEPMVPGRVAQ